MSESQPMDKKRLASYVSLKLEVENRRDKLARLKNEAHIPPARQGNESKHQPGSGDRMERAIIRYMEYEERITPMLHKDEAEMREIESAIDSVEDPLERELLRLRYMDGDFCRLMPWREVALNLFGDDDDRHILTAYRLHGRALVSISNIKK